MTKAFVMTMMSGMTMMFVMTKLFVITLRVVMMVMMMGSVPSFFSRLKWRRGGGNEGKKKWGRGGKGVFIGAAKNDDDHDGQKGMGKRRRDTGG